MVGYCNRTVLLDRAPGAQALLNVHKATYLGQSAQGKSVGVMIIMVCEPRLYPQRLEASRSLVKSQLVSELVAGIHVEAYLLCLQTSATYFDDEG